VVSNSDMRMPHEHMQIASIDGWVASSSGRGSHRSHCRPSVAARADNRMQATNECSLRSRWPATYPGR
jgi:hypothetical protein